MNSLVLEKIVFVFLFATFSVFGVYPENLFAAGNQPIFQNSTADLEKKVAELETRVADLEKILKALQAKSVQDKLPTEQVPVETSNIDSGDIVFFVDSFSKIPDNLKIIAEANELKELSKTDEKEIKRLEEQKRKLLDARKELDRRDRSGRAMSETVYRRLMQENQNQRSDIVSVIAKTKDKISKRTYLEKSKRRDSVSKGQRIEGHFDANKFIFFTKIDCSKIVKVGAQLRAKSPKSIQSINGVEEFEVSSVELAKKVK